ESAAGATLTRQEDGAYLASGKGGERDTHTVEAPVELAGGGGVGAGGVGEAARAGEGGGGGRPPRAAGGARLRRSGGRAVAGGEWGEEDGLGAGGNWAMAAAMDGDPKTGWAIGPKAKEAHTAVFRLASPLGGGSGGSEGSGALMRVTMAQNFGGHHT